MFTASRASSCLSRMGGLWRTSLAAPMVNTFKARTGLICYQRSMLQQLKKPRDRRSYVSEPDLIPREEPEGIVVEKIEVPKEAIKSFEKEFVEFQQKKLGLVISGRYWPRFWVILSGAIGGQVLWDVMSHHVVLTGDRIDLTPAEKELALVESREATALAALLTYIGFQRSSLPEDLFAPLLGLFVAATGGAVWGQLRTSFQINEFLSMKGKPLTDVFAVAFRYAIQEKSFVRTGRIAGQLYLGLVLCNLITAKVFFGNYLNTLYAKRWRCVVGKTAEEVLEEKKRYAPSALRADTYTFVNGALRVGLFYWALISSPFVFVPLLLGYPILIPLMRKALPLIDAYRGFPWEIAVIAIRTDELANLAAKEAKEQEQEQQQEQHQEQQQQQQQLQNKEQEATP